MRSVTRSVTPIVLLLLSIPGRQYPNVRWPVLSVIWSSSYVSGVVSSNTTSRPFLYSHYSINSHLALQEYLFTGLFRSLPSILNSVLDFRSFLSQWTPRPLETIVIRSVSLIVHVFRRSTFLELHKLLGFPLVTPKSITLSSTYYLSLFGYRPTTTGIYYLPFLFLKPKIKFTLPFGDSK